MHIFNFSLTIPFFQYFWLLFDWFLILFSHKVREAATIINLCGFYVCEFIRIHINEGVDWNRVRKQYIQTCSLFKLNYFHDDWYIGVDLSFLVWDDPEQAWCKRPPTTSCGGNCGVSAWLCLKARRRMQYDPAEKDHSEEKIGSNASSVM